MGTVSESTIRAERIEFNDMVDAIDRAGDQFIKQLRELDAADGERKVPGMTWTVAEVAVHMLTIVNRGLGDRRRSDSIPGLAELNDRCVSEVDTRVPAEIADRLAEDKSVLMSLLRAQTPEQAERTTFPLHAGLVTNIPSALSYMLFDFLAHGLDVARGTERDWEIAPSHAALVLHASMPVLGPWAKKSAVDGPAERLAISFPGDGDASVVEVGDGSYRAQNYSRAEVEDVAEVDPVETFLAVAGRAPASKAPAARLAGWFEPI